MNELSVGRAQVRLSASDPEVQVATAQLHGDTHSRSVEVNPWLIAMDRTSLTSAEHVAARGR